MHREEHLRFFDEFVLLRARLTREGASRDNVSRLVEAVERWVAEHVLRQDRDLAEFIRTREAGL